MHIVAVFTSPDLTSERPWTGSYSNRRQIHHVGVYSFQLVVLQIPERLVNLVSVGTPPVRRENAAIKPVFSLRALPLPAKLRRRNSGALDEREWTFEDTRFVMVAIPKATFTKSGRDRRKTRRI